MAFSDHVAGLIEQPRQLNFDSKVVVLDNLVFVYQTIVASEPLLRAAVQRLDPTRSPFDARLLAYYCRHAEEEVGHAEWLADDLAAAGVDAQAAPLHPQAVQAAGSQYYLIAHAHPAALLGYMAVLESRPAELAHITALERRFGPALFRTARYHAEHDPGHAADLRRVLDAVPPYSGLMDLVVENAVNTSRLLNAASNTFGKDRPWD